MAAYSLDLRKRIVDTVERGFRTRNEVARLFGVHESFVYKLLRQAPQQSVAPCGRSVCLEKTDYSSGEADPVERANQSSGQNH